MKKRYLAFLMVFILFVSTFNAFGQVSASSVLQELGLMDREGNTPEKLNESLSRMEGLALVLKALGYTVKEMSEPKWIAENPFRDVPKWFEGYAGLAKKLGIANGRSEDTFDPYEKITKQEFLAYILRALKYETASAWKETKALSVKAGLIKENEKIENVISKNTGAEIIKLALNAEIQNGKEQETLGQLLIRNGIIANKKASEYGIKPEEDKTKEVAIADESTPLGLVYPPVYPPVIPQIPSNPILEEKDFQAFLNGRGFQEPSNLGVAASSVVASAGHFDVFEGRPYLYSTAVGGRFNMVDVLSNRLRDSHQLGDTNLAWTHTTDKNGDVYIPTITKDGKGQIWKYLPKEKKVNKIADLPATYQPMISTTDEVGNVYIGTYSGNGAGLFKYDIQSEQIFSLGNPDESGKSQYIRGIAYHQDTIYIGMGISPKIIKMDIHTHRYEDIGEEILKEVQGGEVSIGLAHDVGVAGEYLFVRVDPDKKNALLFYHFPTAKWKKILHKPEGDGAHGIFGFNQLPTNGDYTYVTYNRKILRINYKTLETFDTGISFPASLRGSYILEKDGKPYLITVSRSGELCWMDVQDFTIKRESTVMTGAPLPLHNVGVGNNGKLYLATYPGGPKGAEYNPNINNYRVYNQGQFESTIAGEGNIQYFGIYPGAVIQKMDTNTGEITNLFNLGEEYEQDRPYVMRYYDEMLYIGTIPAYEKLGGTLAIYNPKTQEKEVYRNIVENQSVVGIAIKDGILYGSTSIFGGLGINPAAQKPKIFLWDLATKEKIGEYDLDISDMSANLISGLTFDKDDKLWGAADGVIFTWDTVEKKVSKYKKLYPEVKRYGRWRPTDIVFGEDGLLYTDLGGKLTVLNPQTDNWKHITLNSDNKTIAVLTLAKDAKGHQSIFYIEADGSEMKMIAVRPSDQPDTEQTESEPNPEPEPEPHEKEMVINGGFEEEWLGWKINKTEDNENVSAILTDEQKKNGEKSLKIVDTSTNPGGAFCLVETEDALSVEAAKKYILKFSTMVSGEEPQPRQLSRAIYYWRFYDKNGKQILEKAERLNPTNGKWQDFQVEVIAPENAVSTKVSFGCSALWMTSGAYFDNVSMIPAED